MQHDVLFEVLETYVKIYCFVVLLSSANGVILFKYGSSSLAVRHRFDHDYVF